MAKLTVVGTSIGNIEDFSIRSLRKIFESPVVLAEDTRVFKKLKMILKDKLDSVIQSLNLTDEPEQIVISYRDQNHDKVFNEILEIIESGTEVSLFSDAGMPAISDPGFKLIRDLAKKGVEIDVIPGPTAVSSSLVLSGLPTDRFVFLGFLPRKNGKAKKIIAEAAEIEATGIIYESPFRVKKTLGMITEELGDKVNVAIVSEITKKFQKVIRGKVEDVLQEIGNKKLKGEWVILFSSK